MWRVMKGTSLNDKKAKLDSTHTKEKDANKRLVELKKSLRTTKRSNGRTVVWKEEASTDDPVNKKPEKGKGPWSNYNKPGRTVRPKGKHKNI